MGGGMVVDGGGASVEEEVGEYMGRGGRRRI